MQRKSETIFTKKNLKKEKNRVGWLTLCDFKTYHKATIIKAEWY